MPTVSRVTSLSAALLRPAVGACSLLVALALGLASSAAATAGVVDQPGPWPGASTVLGSTTAVGEPDARLLTRREAPTVVQSRCTAEGSDEASSYRLPEVMGVFYRVGDREVGGTVEVSDGDKVTVLARTYPGVRFEDDSTEATYVLDFTRCPAPEPAAQVPAAQVPVVQAPVVRAPVVQTPVVREAAPRTPTAAVPTGPVSPTSVAAAGAVSAPTATPAAAPPRATSPAPPTQASPAGRLADTGANPWQAAVLAGAMLLAGTGMLVAGRRS